MEGIDLSSAAGIVSFLSLLAIGAWQAWKSLSPSIKEDTDRINVTKDAAHFDLMARFERARLSETTALDRVEVLELQVDEERSHRRAVEDELVVERQNSRTLSIQLRRAVEKLASFGRDDLSALADNLVSESSELSDPPDDSK